MDRVDARLIAQPHVWKVELSVAVVEDRAPVFRFAHEPQVDDILHLAFVMSAPPLEHTHLAEGPQVICYPAR